MLERIETLATTSAMAGTYLACLSHSEEAEPSAMAEPSRMRDHGIGPLQKARWTVSLRVGLEVDSPIALAAQRDGLDPEWLRTESSGNPKAQTGSYSGLFQLSPQEFERVGAKGDIFDPKEMPTPRRRSSVLTLTRSSANLGDRPS
jgi:hypothetical protein